MLNYVLSLNVNSKGDCCAILFNGNNIQSCLHSNVKSFDSFIETKILPTIKLADTDIILDKNGYGMALKDLLFKHGIRIAYSVNSSFEINKFTTICHKDAIKNMKNDSNFITLKKQLSNLEIEVKSDGRMRLIKKDEKIDNLEARCYLQGLAYIKYIKKDKDTSKNDLDYTRFIYDYDMQMYDLLSDKEEYLKRQMNQTSNKHSNEIMSEINKELLCTQSIMIKNVNKLHENFNQWFNIVKDNIKNEFDNEEYSRLIE